MADVLVAAATEALSEHGDGFSVGPSVGTVQLPGEAATPSAALHLADRRMYADKGRSRSSATRQTRDVLISALREREPDLHEHVTDVAHLAVRVATELGMPAEQRDEVASAAELHDMGKVAIPDAILNKPGPLNEDEWRFMRRHTLIGERILLSAPALRPVAKLVRSSHERWDGTGYPDGLEAEQIPAGRPRGGRVRRLPGDGRRPRLPARRWATTRPWPSWRRAPGRSSTPPWWRRSVR